MDENVEKFVAEAEKGLADASFVKLILSNYKGQDRGLQRISVRLVDTKKGPRMMFQSRFETRDVVKNFDFAEGIDELRQYLNEGFRNAHLFTTATDLQLKIGKRNSHLTKGKAAATPASTAHDRKKKTLVDPDAFYLKALGIADDNGRIKPSQQDKWRQITKFVEILAGLVDASPILDKEELKIVDMGSGKGYLTFAAYDYFTNVKNNARVRTTGVEERAELVETCNDIARAGGFDGLTFVAGHIADIDPGAIDVLIALHACDTATDDALFRGIAAKASVIIAAPCCHKEVRKQLKPPELLVRVLKHGILRERTAETITDGIRSLLLEGEGYTVKMIEFVPTEHTPKNNLLAAVRRGNGGRSAEARKEARTVMDAFGIESQRLDSLLERA